ncbi:hypothetical protein [Microbacterium sp. Gd 4-13]|uniref:hypothetical protein n=1 Tax=Microbacterium sp. Gd 4-13 TaxID=2173179 RepID=UPI001057DF58|nr:hypothetical protein [Microbacterium sp. Gd 4-13]
MSYDEEAIRRRLERLDASQKTAFAACCAERLLQLLVKIANGPAGVVAELLPILDRVWEWTRGSGRDLRGDDQIAEGLVPDDDDDNQWTLLVGYTQNAAACTAYAVRTSLSGSAKEAVWAARQAYEVADLAAQHSGYSRASDGEPLERQLLSAEVVQHALRGIEQDLVGVEGGLPVDVLRRNAKTAAEAWAHMF